MFKCRECDRDATTVFKLHVPYRYLTGDDLNKDIELCHRNNQFLCDTHAQRHWEDGNGNKIRYIPIYQSEGWLPMTLCFFSTVS